MLEVIKQKDLWS